RPVGELVQLLAHDDMRIRQEAQFALADQGQAAVEPLAGVARKHAKQLARIHAIWGLGQVGRKEPAALKPLHELVKDSDAEVRAQAAKVLGDARAADAYEALLPLLRDPEARVRFFAAQSLGKLGKKEATAGLLQLLRENNDQDVYLRHAAAVALARLDDRAALLSAAKDEAAAVRLGALLALRRLESPEIAVFLHDAEPRLVLEAARAINDVPIPAALPKLAALSERPKLPDAVGYRALNAHFRLGQSANAKALAAFAGRADVPETQRVEALRYLGDWAKPASRDRVVGLWRPLEARDPQPAAEAVRTALGGVLSGPDKVRQEGAKLAAKYGIQDIGPTLLSMLSDPKGNAATRVEMLQALHALNDQRLPEAVKLALADGDARVRTAGRRVQARVQPMEALPGLLTAVERGETVERQGALLALADLKEPRVDAFLITWLDKLLAKDVPAEVQLDLLEAAARRSSPEVKKKLGQVEAARDAKDPLAPYRETLAGGDAEAGRRLFLHKAEVSCLRCHKVQGEGGEVGPELTGIAAKQPREYLLESIVAPNRQIAKGFETTVLGLKNGQIVTGIVKTETGQEIQLMTAEGKLVQVAKDQIDERQTGKSPMPEDILKSLTKRELRDLVEFLAGLK
ncbi:MAG: HEAT repeat domain-containing protein, partial [Planctomycetia bacterium]|nr:HEAT repeat domain-containing protein [Planctomycetia bacterium]